MTKGFKWTPMRRLFVAEYIVDFNGEKAAARAGYSVKTAKGSACELLKLPEIKAEIDAAIEAQKKRTGITADYVLNGIKEIAERCMQREKVMEFDKANLEWVQATDKEGHGIWRFDSNGAIRAFELLGKHLKLFTDKLELTGGPVPLQIILSDDKGGNEAPPLSKPSDQGKP